MLNKSLGIDQDELAFLENPVRLEQALQARNRIKSQIDAHLDGLLASDKFYQLEKAMQSDRELFEYYQSRKLRLDRITQQIPVARINADRVRAMSLEAANICIQFAPQKESSKLSVLTSKAKNWFKKLINI